MNSQKSTLRRLARSTFRRGAALAALATVIAVPTLRAATGTWNIDANTTGWGTSTNWLSGTIPNGIDDIANFTFNLTAARTINLDGDRTLGTMTVGDPTTAFFGYTFSANGQGGALTFDTSTGDTSLVAGTNPSLTFSAASTAGSAFNVPIQLNDSLVIHALNAANDVFNGNITGAGGLIVDSSGTHGAGTSNLIGQVQLTGVNTFTGGMSITGVRVNVAGVSSIGTGAITVNDGGSIFLPSAGIYTNNFTLNGFGWNETTQAQFGALRSDGNSTLTGSITLAGNSRLGGTGGTTLINGVISDGGSGRNLEINRLQTGGVAAATTFVLNNTNAYSGKTTVYSGTLRIGDSGTTGSLGTTSGLEFANANIEFRRNDNVTVTTPFTQLTGTIGGVAVTGSNFIHSGNGNLTIDNGSSGYTGATTVSGVNGKLSFGSGGAYTFAGTGTVTLSNGADLEFNTSSAVNLGTITLVVADAGKSFLMQSGSGTTTLGGAVDNAFAGAIVSNGTLVLAKASTAAIHAIGSNSNVNLVVNGGTLKLGGTGGDQIATSTDVQVNGGTFDLGGTSEGFDVLTGNGGTVLNSVAATTSTLTLGENNSTVNPFTSVIYATTYGGSIQNGAGTTAVVKAGTGLQTFSGASSYTGGTTINAGTLSVTGSLAAAGPVAVNSGGTLSGTGSVGAVTLATGGSLRPGATSLDTATGTLTAASLAVNGGDLRFNFAAGNDFLNVTGTASFTGAATISPTFSAPPAIGTTLFLNADGGLTLGVAPTLTGLPATTRSTFALLPVGNGLSLDVSGAAAKSLTWTGANGTNWNLNTTASFNGGGTETFYNLDAVTFGDQPFNRVVTLAAGLNPTSVTVNNSTGNDYTFQTGSIAGGATSLTKSGNGTLFLNTANTFGGAVTITGGTIKAGNAAALGDANGQTFVSGGGAFDLNGLNVGAEVINISGTGVGGAGALVNTSATGAVLRFLNLTGNATIGGTSGRFDIGSGASGLVDLAGFTLTKTGTNLVYLANAGSGVAVTNGNIDVQGGTLGFAFAGALLQGTGTVTFNPGTTGFFYQTVAANITRNIVVNNAILGTEGQNSAIGSNITLAGNLTVQDTANTLTLTGNISESGGSRSLFKNNGGALALSGNNSFTGSLTSTGGTINLSGTNAITGPVSLTNSTLQVLSTTTTNATLGTPSSISLNASTLRLNLLNSYTLPTTTTVAGTGNNLIFNGQTQGTTLTVNSTIGSSVLLGSFQVEQGTAVLASGANITVATTNVGMNAGTLGNLGTLNIQPGAALTTNILYIGEGAAGRTGIVNQSGGTVNVMQADFGNDGSLRIGHWNGTGSTYNLSGGTLNALAGNTSIGVDGVDAALNVSGGTANFYRLFVDGRAGGTGPIGGTLNLSGGEVSIGAGGLSTFANSQVNLSGGTLSASAPTTWSTGLHFVNNSPTLDTRGNAVALSGVLVGAGGFTKTGNGRLTISNANSLVGGTINANAGETYLTGSLLNPTATLNVSSGATVLLDGSGANTGVVNGTVNVNTGAVLYGAGNGTTTGKIGTLNVNAGADLRPGLSIGTLAAGAMTMNGGVARFELNGTNTTTGGGVNDLVAVTNGLTFTGGNILPSFTTAPANGNVYTLFTSGALTGLPSVDPSATNSRVTYGIAAAGNNVTLTVTGTAKALTWTGATNGTWDVNTTANWSAGGAENFYQADSVTFDGTAPGTVTLVGGVQPAGVTVNSTANYSFTGGSIDTGSLTKAGTGTLALLSPNGYTGGTTVTGGVLSFSNGSLGATGPITMNGGTLQWNGSNTQDVSTRLAMVAATTATLDTNGNNVTLVNPLGNSTTGALTKTGAGTLTLLGANTYTGATTVSNGTLSIGNGTGPGSIAGGSAVSVASGATMKWNNAYSSTVIATIANPISGAGTVLLQGQNSTTALQTSLYDFTGANAGFTGTLQINRAILTNVAPADFGSATVELQDRGSFFGTTAGTYTNNFIVGPDSGWHHNVGGADVVIGAIRLQGTNILSGNITLNNTTSIALGDNTSANSTIGAYVTSDDTLTGVISGPGDFAMSRYTGFNGGTAQQVDIRLGGSSSNTYAGKTVIDGQGAGIVSLWLQKTGGAVAIPANTVVQFGSGTGGQSNLRMGGNDQFGANVLLNFVNASGQWGRFDLKGTTQTVAGLNAGTSSVQGGAVIQNQGIDGVLPTANGLLTLNGSGTYLYNGYIRNSDNGSAATTLALTKSGTGTQTLVGNQITYTGATTVNDGILRLQDTTAFVSPTVTVNGGTLQIQSALAGTVNSSIVNNSAVEMNASTAGITFIVGNTKTLSGAGTWTKTGAGRVTFNNNTVNLTGNIFVQAGTLGNDNNATVWTGSSANLDISAGATFDARADSVRFNAITGAGTLTNSYGNGAGVFDTLTIGVANGSGTFSGAITDGGAAGAGENKSGMHLTKLGTGTQILSGTNTYAGVTTISAGTVQIGNGGTTGTLGTNTVVNNGALIFNRSNQFNVNNVINGTGSVTKAGTGTMVLNSQSVYTGATTISGGTLRLGADTTLPVASAIQLDATDGSTINTAAGGVTGWTNKGSLGAVGNTTAPTGLEPAYVAAEPAMNNQPVIHFDASGTGGAPFDQLTNNIDFSTSDVTIMYAGRLSGGANFRLLSGLNNSSNWLLGAHGGLSDRAHLGNASAFVDQGGTSANTLAHVYTGINGSNGFAAFYADTVLKGATTNAATYFGPNGLSLGGGYSGAPLTEHSDGDIGELLVFTKILTEEERRSVEAYLSRKWKGLGNTNLLPTATPLSLTASGATLDVNGVTQTVGSISGVAGANILLGGGSLTAGSDNTSTSFDGVISGPGTLAKTGTGTWTLSGVNTNAGATSVLGGTLNVTGTLGGTVVSVAASATLSGTGTITADISALSGGAVAPGSGGAGALNTSNLTLNTSSVLNAEIGGTTAGSQYDQLNVTGGITLGGDLNVATINGFTPTPSQHFWLALNDGGDAVSGSFGNAPITDIPNSSGTFISGGTEWIVYYGANFGSDSTTGGNDILLAVPEPGTVMTVLCGVGMVLGTRRRRRAASL